ncbi:hypothetical protein TCDM_11190 [Trypanosoma cruzi Dm28c]|uniref:Uncharacterized protein n=1 Tax=Trypanosoma cruzi Dm28c TaxID=1416333 RepID=V5BA29_TRYCR|nr:hypothetical protein TCDM_11190 [Trypanosoma cruzi Dm28c]
MHADDRTLVALCADLRVCGAAMPAAVSVVTTCAAEHSLSISADGSGAALFCIASHGQSDEDTADYRLGGGKPRVNPTLCVCSAMRLIGTSILFRTSPSLQGRPCHAAIGCGWAQELVRPSTPCDPFLLDASTVRCTTAVRRPHRVGPTHLHSLEVSHGDSCTASLVPRVSAKDTSVHLAVNPAPLRRIVGFRAPTQHERLTRLRYIDDVRGAVCSETAPSSITGKAATTIPLPGDAVLKELRRVRGHMGISPDHIRAPHAEHRVFARDTASCSGVGVFRPRHAKDAPEGVRRSALEAACNPLGPYDAGRWTDSSSSWTMHLDPLHCHLTPRTAALPVGPRRTAAGSLACTCRAECPVTEHGLRQFPVPRLAAAAASQSPTRVPVATDSLSAMESLRLDLLAVHDKVSEEICTVPHSPAD